MAKRNDFYGGNYLKAANVKKPTVAKIEGVEPQKLPGEDRAKLVATLKGMDKQLVLNATNAGTLGDLYGDDYCDWVGKKIVLFVDKTDFNGRRVDCIRLRAPKTTPAPPPEPEEVEDDEIAEFEEE